MEAHGTCRPNFDNDRSGHWREDQVPRHHRRQVEISRRRINHGHLTYRVHLVLRTASDRQRGGQPSIQSHHFPSQGAPMEFSAPVRKLGMCGAHMVGKKLILEFPALILVRARPVRSHRQEIRISQCHSWFHKRISAGKTFWITLFQRVPFALYATRFVALRLSSQAPPRLLFSRTRTSTSICIG